MKIRSNKSKKKHNKRRNKKNGSIKKIGGDPFIIGSTIAFYAGIAGISGILMGQLGKKPDDIIVKEEDVENPLHN